MEYAQTALYAITYIAALIGFAGLIVGVIVAPIAALAKLLFAPAVRWLYKSAPGEAAGGERREALIITGAAALTALLYAVCFSGRGVEPQLSFALFCPAVFIISAWALKKLGRLNQPRALWLALPLAALSSFNAVFTDSFFTYANVCLALALLTLFIITVVAGRPPDLSGAAGWALFVRAVLGRWTAWINLLKSIFAGSAKGKSFQAGRKILFGVLLALPVLAVLSALLMSADVVFSRLWEDLWAREASSFDRDNLMFIVTLAGAWVYFCGYFSRSQELGRTAPPAPAARPPADVWVGATFLGAVNLLFLAFSWVQMAYLFQGGFMTLPPGLVYSEYAREGFFQLLAATVINFALLFIFMGWFKGARESRALRSMLLGLCLFTGVLIASSFYRLSLYTGAYGYTALRLKVLTFLCLEVLWVLIAAAHLLSPKIALGRNFLAAGFIFYLLANIVGGDYAAARLNINLFLNGRIENIDAGALGPDGLGRLRSLKEADGYFFRGDGIVRLEPGADPKSFSYYMLKTIEKLEKDGRKWQSRSYFKDEFLDSLADNEHYRRALAAKALMEEKAAYERTWTNETAQAGENAQTKTKEPCAFRDLKIPPNAKVYAVINAGRSERLGWLLKNNSRGAEGALFDVTVNSPEEPVLLILNSSWPALWQIGWTEGSEILAILAYGYDSQFVNGPPDETPVLTSEEGKKWPCPVFSFDSGLEDLKRLDIQSQELFGRSPAALPSPDEEGRVLIGRPLEPGEKVITAKALVREDFKEPGSLPVGRAGLEEALRQGFIRPAEQADYVPWLKARIETIKKTIEDSGLPDNLRPKLNSDLEISLPLEDVFVVLRPDFLRRELAIPVGLRETSPLFIVPADFPTPETYDYSSLMTISDGRCRGGGHCQAWIPKLDKYMWNANKILPKEGHNIY